MNIEELRAYCLSLPRVTEDVKWGSDLCFLVGNKIFAITTTGPTAEFGCSLKCDPETFARLVEREDISPSPYLARYHWVAVNSETALTKKEWRERIKGSYDEVFAKLPTKIKRSIS